MQCVLQTSAWFTGVLEPKLEFEDLNLVVLEGSLSITVNHRPEGDALGFRQVMLTVVPLEPGFEPGTSRTCVPHVSAPIFEITVRFGPKPLGIGGRETWDRTRTFCSSDRCADQLHHLSGGASRQARTADLPRTGRTLFRLSYRSVVAASRVELEKASL